MKIKLLTSIASSNWSYAPGDCAEFPDDEAKRLITAGYAEPIEVERATATPNMERAISDRKAKR